MSVSMGAKKAVHGLMAAVFLQASVAAYLHLSLVPHRYCPKHHVIEPVQNDDQGLPNPLDGHPTCPWEFLLDQSLDRDEEGGQTTEPADVWGLEQVNCPFCRHPEAHPVVIAPKTSPPASI